MPIQENSPEKEPYREIPASILKQAPESRAIRTRRFSRYLFGVGILAAFAFMGYLAVTNQLVANDGPSEAEIEQLVAEYEASSASDPANRSAAAADSAGSDSAVLGDVQIQITSDPEGANVEIDGQHVGSTPLTHLLTPGAYILSLQHADHRQVDTVLVFVEGGQEEFAFNLAESVGGTSNLDATLSGLASPANDFRTSSASRVDRSPAQAANVETSPAGSENRLDTERTAQNAPVLVISSHPAGASALLDGRFIGRTPLSTESVDPGTHQVRLFMDGFEPHEESIRVQRGETTTVHGELARRTGELTVLVRPWGSIYVDGVLHEAQTDVRYATNIPAGEHTVVAVHPTLGSVSRTVSVRAGNTTNVTLDLENKQ